jgi:hypothetical protein
MTKNIERPPLSSTPCERAWLSQFPTANDKAVAQRILDAVFLMNEEDVSRAIRALIRKYACAHKRRTKYIALFAEREMPEQHFFESQLTVDREGKPRMRAYGAKGRPAVKPKRGGVRVGSEGPIAFLISQLAEDPTIRVKNHPGPDRIRAKSSPVRTIGLVTDFIGSGTRILSLLDKLWAVPSVKSWISTRNIKLAVFAAAGTVQGIAAVKAHRTAPRVNVTHVVSSLFSKCSPVEQLRRETLLAHYGPSSGRGGGVLGYKGSAALIAFSYRLPNNLPPIFTEDDPSVGWRALYKGPVPEDSASAFGIRPSPEIVAETSEALGLKIATDLEELEEKDALVLQAIRGRWRAGAQVALAELTGLSVPEVLMVYERAIRYRLLDSSGRLTDVGQAFLAAGTQRELKRPTIPTRSDSYYPSSLRTPRFFTSIS